MLFKQRTTCVKLLVAKGRLIPPNDMQPTRYLPRVI